MAVSGKGCLGVGAAPRAALVRSPDGECDGRGEATPRPFCIKGHDVVLPLPWATMRRPQKQRRAARGAALLEEAAPARLLAFVGGLVVGGFFLGLGLTAQDGLGEEATIGEVGDVAFADEEREVREHLGLGGFFGVLACERED